MPRTFYDGACEIYVQYVAHRLPLSPARERRKKSLFRARENYTYAVDKNIQGGEKKVERDRNITTVEIYAAVNKSAKAHAVYLIGSFPCSHVK